MSLALESEALISGQRVTEKWHEGGERKKGRVVLMVRVS